MSAPEKTSPLTESEGFFYTTRHAQTAASARAVLRPVFDALAPQSVVDFGCGVGTWLRVCMDFGAKQILGIDGDYVPARELVIPHAMFMKADLHAPVKLDKMFDLVISCEVAEHLPEKSASPFVASLVGAGPVVLFSAAIPGQGGYKHINEQWPAYWTSLFAEHRYQLLDIMRPLVWNNSEVLPWYRQNIMLYAAPDAVERIPVSWRRGDCSFQGLPVVHPETFRVVQSAHPIGGREALHVLGKALLRRLGCR